MKIKEGDIFYSGRGIAVFYQVVKVYDSGRVRIREIDKTEVPTEVGYEFLATPIKDKFLKKEKRNKRNAYVGDIIDNDKGVIKLVKYFDDGSAYIEFIGSIAYLYEDKPVISSYYYVWLY